MEGKDLRGWPWKKKYWLIQPDPIILGLVLWLGWLNHHWKFSALLALFFSLENILPLWYKLGRFVWFVVQVSYLSCLFTGSLNSVEDLFYFLNLWVVKSFQWTVLDAGFNDKKKACSVRLGWHFMGMERLFNVIVWDARLPKTFIWFEVAFI